MKSEYEYKIEPNSTGILCKVCGWVAVSHYTHDYKTCGCENGAMIDGGRSYTRYGAKDLAKIVLLNVSEVVFKKGKSKPKKKSIK